MQNPQISRPTVRFNEVYISDKAIVASSENGEVVMATLDRFPMLEACAASGRFAPLPLFWPVLTRINRLRRACKRQSNDAGLNLSFIGSSDGMHTAPGFPKTPLDGARSSFDTGLGCK